MTEVATLNDHEIRQLLLTLFSRIDSTLPTVAHAGEASALEGNPRRQVRLEQVYTELYTARQCVVRALSDLVAEGQE